MCGSGLGGLCHGLSGLCLCGGLGLVESTEGAVVDDLSGCRLCRCCLVGLLLVGLLLIGLLSRLLLVGRLGGGRLGRHVGHGRSGGGGSELGRGDVGLAEGLNGLQSFGWLPNQTDDHQADHAGDDQGDTGVEDPVVALIVRGARRSSTAIGFFCGWRQHGVDDVNHPVRGLHVHRGDVGALDHARREDHVIAVGHAEFLAVGDVAGSEGASVDVEQQDVGQGLFAFLGVEGCKVNAGCSEGIIGGRKDRVGSFALQCFDQLGLNQGGHE